MSGPRHEHVDWREHGVKVIKGDQLDTNTAQLPGMNRAATTRASGRRRSGRAPSRSIRMAKTGAHHHGALESVIYVVRGQARMRWANISSS